MGTPSFTLLYEIIIGKNKSESILGVSRKIKKKKTKKKNPTEFQKIMLRKSQEVEEKNKDSRKRKNR